MGDQGSPGRRAGSRSGRRARGKCSTRDAPSRSSPRSSCCSRPAPVGLAPTVLRWLSRARSALAVVLSRFRFPLRGRALLWLAGAGLVPLLEPWRRARAAARRARGLPVLHGRLLGTLYYRLRTGRRGPTCCVLAAGAHQLRPPSGTRWSRSELVMTLSAGACWPRTPPAPRARIAVAAGAGGWRSARWPGDGSSARGAARATRRAAARAATTPSPAACT